MNIFYKSKAALFSVNLSRGTESSPSEERKTINNMTRSGSLWVMPVITIITPIIIKCFLYFCMDSFNRSLFLNFNNKLLLNIKISLY